MVKRPCRAYSAANAETTRSRRKPWWRRVFERVTLQGPAYPDETTGSAGDVPWIADGLGGVWGAVRVDAGVLDRPAADGGPGALSPEYDDGACTTFMGRCLGRLRWNGGWWCRTGDLPPVLRQAILSIEDKSFERNWGVNLVRAVGAA